MADRTKSRTCMPFVLTGGRAAGTDRLAALLLGQSIHGAASVGFEEETPDLSKARRGIVQGTARPRRRSAILRISVMFE